MGFNKSDFVRIRAEYSKRYLKAQEASDERRRELYEKIPGLRELDKQLSCTGLRIMDAMLGQGENAQANLAIVRRENEALVGERGALLRAYGYPEDYTDVHYECDKCGDTGYVGTKMCDCMRHALVLAGYESSGIGALMKSQSFENFSLDFYRTTPNLYATMKYAYDKVRSFAENFGSDTYTNFLFMGGTGLGKTHLSTSAAKVVIDRGFDVLYVTAGGMIGDFEQKRFGNSALGGVVEDTSRYYGADLLIIDDLGTEIANQFTVSCIYDIINARIVKRKSTIISTNLNQEEIAKRYWDRITSRLFGEYLPIVFAGTDIRKQKITKRV